MGVSSPSEVCAGAGAAGLPRELKSNSRLLACEKLSLGDLFREQMDRVLPLKIGGSQGSDGKVACSLESSSALSVRLLWGQGDHSRRSYSKHSVMEGFHKICHLC